MPHQMVFGFAAFCFHSPIPKREYILMSTISPSRARGRGARRIGLLSQMGGVCETGGERRESLTRVPSLPQRMEREVQTSPTPAPRRTEQWGTDTRDLEREFHGLTVAIQTPDNLAGTERRQREEIEVGVAEIKGRENPLPPGWE